MKNTARLEQLLSFLEKEPDDPFLLYAVGTEYLSNNPQKTLFYFDKLLSEHPKYTATYYHAAALYTALTNYQKADEIYRKGMKICQAENEHHALRELKSAYEMFLMEYEEEL